MKTMRNASRCWRLFTFVTFMVLVSGCTRFHRDWRAVSRQPSSGWSDSIEGPWKGSWLSDENGHKGALRCLLTKDAEGRYQARFRANYKKVLSFSYTVPLEVQREGHLARFTGEADLGQLAGGVYTYEGNASPSNFFSNYKSEYDHGTFWMTRP